MYPWRRALLADIQRRLEEEEEKEECEEGALEGRPSQAPVFLTRLRTFCKGGPGGGPWAPRGQQALGGCEPQTLPWPVLGAE